MGYAADELTKQTRDLKEVRLGCAGPRRRCFRRLPACDSLPLPPSSRFYCNRLPAIRQSIVRTTPYWCLHKLRCHRSF